MGAVSSYTFFGVNLDRTYAIKKPMAAYSMSTNKFWVSILMCWVLAIIPSAPYLMDTSLTLCMEQCTACYIAADNVSIKTLTDILQKSAIQKPLLWWHNNLGTCPFLGHANSYRNKSLGHHFSRARKLQCHE